MCGTAPWSSVAVNFVISALSIAASILSLNASSRVIDAIVVSASLSQLIVSSTVFLSFRQLFLRSNRTIARFCVGSDTVGRLHRFSSRMPPHLRVPSFIWAVRRSMTSSPLYITSVYWRIVFGLASRAQLIAFRRVVRGLFLGGGFRHDCSASTWLRGGAIVSIGGGFCLR